VNMSIGCPIASLVSEAKKRRIDRSLEKLMNKTTNQPIEDANGIVGGEPIEDDDAEQLVWIK